MTQWLAGFFLGVAGSGHCLGMCGPFVLFAGSRTSADKAAISRDRVLHHVGRIGVYVTLGALAGVGGSAIAWAGFRNTLAIATGAVLVAQALGLVARASGGAPGRWITTLTGRLGALTRALPQHHAARALLLGVVNGLLPCGLLYAALAAAAGLGDVPSAVRFTIGFGAGLLPAFALLAYSTRTFLPHIPKRVKHATPVALALVGVMLIVRGWPVAGGGHLLVHPIHSHSRQ